jgi:single-strand DNA-binding protein
MAGEPDITLVGNIGGDAEMKTTPNGKLVTSFNLAVTPRVQKNNEWTDGETMWLRCFVWGKDATGAANEIRKGQRVLVQGRFKRSVWTDKEGAERVSLEVEVDEYGIKPRNVAEPVTVNPEVARRAEDPIDDPWSVKF